MKQNYRQLTLLKGKAEKDPLDSPQPKAAPQFTLLICLSLGIITSSLLLANSIRTISTDQDVSKNGQTEVTFEIVREGSTAINETAMLNSLPSSFEERSYWVMIAASSYANFVFLILALLACRPDKKSLFLSMPAVIAAAIYVFVLAAIAGLAFAAAYGIKDDEHSDFITNTGMRLAANGTYPGTFAPAAWYCDLTLYSKDFSRTTELHDLCAGATSALGYTTYATVFSVPVAIVLIPYIAMIRKRKTWMDMNPVQESRMQGSR